MYCRCKATNCHQPHFPVLTSKIDRSTMEPMLYRTWRSPMKIIDKTPIARSLPRFGHPEARLLWSSCFGDLSPAGENCLDSLTAWPGPFYQGFESHRQKWYAEKRTSGRKGKKGFITLITFLSCDHRKRERGGKNIPKPWIVPKTLLWERQRQTSRPAKHR